ncbi:M-phase inducer phosphatase-like [Liolophura sinensis]|uniref:M-phase inducer phosphatase-like n=1 Tax=Liolophura sinensis TaxID=3198878 RepID=UPI00315964F4
MSMLAKHVSESGLMIRSEESTSPNGIGQLSRPSAGPIAANLIYDQSPVRPPGSLPEKLEKNLQGLSVKANDSSVQMSDSPDSGVSVGDDVSSLCLAGSGDFESEDSLDGFINSKLDFESLLHAPLLDTAPKSPVQGLYTIRRPSSRRLTRRFDSLNVRQKRPSPARREGESPEMKKRRETGINQRSYSLELPALSKNSVKRCQSANEAVIKLALDRVHNDPLLISDGTKPFCLPTIPGKHQDLTSITPETLARVINDEFCDVIQQYLIIDCRYPFEYNGGHIQGAVNCFTKDSIMENLLKSPMNSTNSEKRTILIFHCEFSSERAPKLSRFLRSMDRDVNKDCYPHLHYPEVYLLHGGYKNFYETQKELCCPQTYVPMLHADYKDDLRTFRAKWKSWPGEKKSRFTLF